MQGARASTLSKADVGLVLMEPISQQERRALNTQLRYCSWNKCQGEAPVPGTRRVGCVVSDAQPVKAWPRQHGVS